MASFAAQLVDVLYGLVERLTGYTHTEDKGAADATEPSKLASADQVFRTDEVIEIKSRDPIVQGGSKVQVNQDGI